MFVSGGHLHEEALLSPDYADRYLSGFGGGKGRDSFKSMFLFI